MTELNLTKKHLVEWGKNKLLNPLTKRKIKENGPVYKKIKKQYDITIKEVIQNDNYEYYRRNKIDPILLTELPINGMKQEKIFKYEYKWNPYNGEKSNIKDDCGPLCFDPNALIHFFYSNRLNNLWKDGEYNDDENYFVEGYYGDALGKYPDFNIVGRGKYPEMYLFRLPILDCYLEKDHCLQTVTMGPILTNKDIKKINSLADRNIFKSIYNYNKPNLYKMKLLYDQAVNPLVEYDDNEELTKNEIDSIKFQINTCAVKKLLNF